MPKSKFSQILFASFIIIFFAANISLAGWVTPDMRREKMELEQNKESDRKDGEFRDYHHNGKLKSITTYENYQKNGPYKEYNEAGELTRELTFANGRLDGPTKSYCQGQRLCREGQYENGERVGRWQDYFLNGRVRKIYEYQYGREVTIADYYDNGEPRRKVLPDDFQGSAQYAPNGRLQSTMTYAEPEFNDAEGNRALVHRIYGPEGKVKSETFTRGGKLFLRREYYISGRLMSETPIDKGMVHGTKRTYYESGQVKYEITMEHNQQAGKARYYDENGQLISEQ